MLHFPPKQRLLAIPTADLCSAFSVLIKLTCSNSGVCMSWVYALCLFILTGVRKVSFSATLNLVESFYENDQKGNKKCHLLENDIC